MSDLERAENCYRTLRRIMFTGFTMIISGGFCIGTMVLFLDLTVFLFLVPFASCCFILGPYLMKKGMERSAEIGSAIITRSKRLTDELLKEMKKDTGYIPDTETGKGGAYIDHVGNYRKPGDEHDEDDT